MSAINFISTLEMQKTRVTQKTKNWANTMQPWKQLHSEKKTNIKQFTINTPIIKMLKKRSNINNNLSCKKHRTHILDLSFRRNNLKIGLSALSKKPSWLLHDLKNFQKFFQTFPGSPWLFKILIISPGFPGSPSLSEPCHIIKSM